MNSPINFLPSPEDILPFAFADQCHEDTLQPFWTLHAEDHNDHKQPPALHVYHSVNTSRVETQIWIQLTLSPLPDGVTKLHLQRNTLGRPKLLAKEEERVKSPDTLELHTFLVRGSAMRDEVNRLRAFEAAAHRAQQREGEVKDVLPTEHGGEVRICERCKFRERKRVLRRVRMDKGQDSWDEFEDERVVVFNDSEYKRWEPPFSVIFTIVDYKGNKVAQRMTNPILMTDRHKSISQPSPSPSSCKRIASSTPSTSSSPGNDLCIIAEDSPRTPPTGEPKRRKIGSTSHTSRHGRSLKDANSEIQALLSLTDPPQAASLLAAATEEHGPHSPTSSPRIYKIVPPQCPKHGGCEVVCLGENFDRNVQIAFGGKLALTTTFWNSQTVVCMVPPSGFAGLVPASVCSDPQALDSAFNPSIAFMYVDGG
ncbi:SPT3 Dosage dependent suppressor of Ty-induced promoter mutations-like protein [Diplodia intermedia]|uniref:SPT3 Dosage dependent suppressor of Ty-induced promoter mutations-like protein n=1 Tax=Diplodia intermedia TaxID=856260 RepID=A0ABR3T9J0_9PEZI